MGVSYFDAPPEETLMLNGLDTGMRRFEGPVAGEGEQPPSGPLAYLEYEIVDATFDADEAVRSTAGADSGDDDARDDLWVVRAVPDGFALPDIRTAHLQREVYEEALERLSRDILRPAAGA